MALVVLLDVDGEVAVVEGGDVAAQRTPLGEVGAAHYLHCVSELPQRHAAVATDLQHLEVELEQLLQALDQLDHPLRLHLGPVQLDLQVVDGQQLQQGILEVHDFLDLVEGEVEVDPFEGLEAGDGLDEHVDFALGECVVLEADEELLEAGGAGEGDAEVVDDVLQQVIAVVEVKDLAVLGKRPARRFLALDVALIHEDG